MSAVCSNSNNFYLQANFDLIAGMSCNTNKSLSFLVVDSVHYHAFAERLGIDVLASANKTIAVIMDHDVCVVVRLPCVPAYRFNSTLFVTE